MIFVDYIENFVFVLRHRIPIEFLWQLKIVNLCVLKGSLYACGLNPGKSRLFVSSKDTSNFVQQGMCQN
jgi:hypothetical protein